MADSVCAPRLTKPERKAFFRHLCALAIPMALQNLINVGVSAADVIMLGKLNETALSGVSLAGQMQFIMTLFCFGIASGATSLTSQYWGKGDIPTVEKILALLLRMAGLIGLLFSLLSLLWPAGVMRIFTPEQAVIDEGVKYLRFVGFSYFFSAFTNCYLNFMRCVERVVVSTVVFFTSLVVNVLLNAVFIFGLLGAPAMGAAGAALATLIARLTEFAMVMVYAFIKNKQVRIRIKYLCSLDLWLVKDFLFYAFPVLLNEMCWGFACSAGTAIMGQLGSAAVAANSVAQTTRQFSMVAAFGVADSAAVVIGKAIGEGRMEHARCYGRLLNKVGLVTGLAGAAVILLMRPAILLFMSLSELALSYLSMMLYVMAGITVAQSVNSMIICGILRGGGDTRFAVVLEVIAKWAFSTLWCALAAFVFHWPVMVVYLFFMGDEIVKLLPALWRYKTHKWLKNITRDF